MIRLFFLILMLIPALSFANLQYMNKFNIYRYWMSHLPPQYNSELANFINQPGLLNSRLRDRWLLYLGEKQNWSLISQYYQPSSSTQLQCYAAMAYWHEHQNQKAIRIATPLWLNGHSQPKNCNLIFHILASQPDWRKIYWNKRIILALDARQIHLARELLQKGNIWDQKAANDLWRLHSQPESIWHIKHNPWYGEETLYALKRMIDLNRPLTKIEANYYKALQVNALNHDQAQRFAVFISLYLAMRNDAKTITWFNKVLNPYITPTLLEWQMRYALLHQQWSRVKLMVLKMPKPYTPEQSYWLARAELARHEKDSANNRLQQLSKQRNYYGFLASLALHQKPQFQEKPSCNNYALLKDYHSLLSEITEVYNQHMLGKAGQLLSDFILELPKNEQCTLVNWVANRLNWPTQAIILSNQPHLFDQIDVRFPTKYANAIHQQAKQNHLDSTFVFAIVRQESAFHPEIVSPVGAKGLMQLMPRTAQLISKRYRIVYHKDKELFQPQKNIEIGTRYLSDLNKSLNHPLLVAAAYNAGPQAVSRWRRLYPESDVITWIDTLPWKETRNYIKNIVAFQAIYQHRLKQQVSIQKLLKPLPIQK